MKYSLLLIQQVILLFFVPEGFIISIQVCCKAFWDYFLLRKCIAVVLNAIMVYYLDKALEACQTPKV